MDKLLRKASRAAGVAVSLSAAIATGAAYADGWGNNDGWSGARPDDKTHRMCFPSSVPSSLWWAAMDAMDVLQDLTTVTSVYSSCGSSTDIWVTDSDLGSTWLGLYTCQSFHGNGECNDALVEINYDWYASQSYGWNGPSLESHLQHDLCHEIGHSVGLSHDDSDPDCMKNGDHEIHHYRVHHINHIDNGIQ